MVSFKHSVFGRGYHAQDVRVDYLLQLIRR